MRSDESWHGAPRRACSVRLFRSGDHEPALSWLYSAERVIGPGILSMHSLTAGGTMVFFVPATLLSWCIDLGTLGFQSDRDKELAILLLRRQLAIFQRT